MAREAAFIAAAQEDGRDVQIMRTGPTGYATGAEAARQLFSRAVTPDGVFCITDLLAMGCMDVARDEFGIVVPDELSIIGFDDIDQAAWIAYNLTTFRQPLGAIAEHIAALLASDGSTAIANETVSFQPVPVWRRSVRPRVPRSGE